MKKRSRGTVALLAALGIMAAPTAAQDSLWVRQLGSGAHDWAQALCPDGAGGVFVAGYTDGSLGGPSAGGRDFWLARYTGAGGQSWIRQFGSGAAEEARALCPDGTGGVFVAGHTAGGLGGPFAGGLADAWLARYDSAGNRTWIRQFGTGALDTAGALSADGAGGAFVAGYTEGSLGGPNAGLTDAWLARYDSAGNRAWIRQFGTPTREGVNALCPGVGGGAFVAGSTRSSLGGPALGAYDAWLARYDSAGNRTWIRQTGTGADDSAEALCPDGGAGVIVAGSTRGDFGGPNVGVSDAWVARYDSAGNRAWVRQFGSVADDSAYALCTDGAGGALVTGETTGPLVPPGLGGYDIPLVRYDGAGNRLWVRQLGTAAEDGAWAICSDGAGGAFAAGYTDGSFGGPNAGAYDGWLARFGCYADCDQATGLRVLDIFDFLCFQNRYDAQDPYACDCDTSSGPLVCDIFDFLCFQNAYAAGCP